MGRAGIEPATLGLKWIESDSRDSENACKPTCSEERRLVWPRAVSAALVDLTLTLLPGPRELVLMRGPSSTARSRCPASRRRSQLLGAR
jgi:hypothetical protein